MPESDSVPASLSMQDQARMSGMQFGTDMVKLIETILEDNSVRDNIKATGADNAMWAARLKSMKLTFLTDVDAAVLQENFEESVINYMLTKGVKKIGMDDINAIHNLRMVFLANVKRSVGTADNRMNERVAQLTTITHQIGKFTEESKSGSRMPSIGRLLGKR